MANKRQPPSSSSDEEEEESLNIIRRRLSESPPSSFDTALNTLSNGFADMKAENQRLSVENETLKQRLAERDEQLLLEKAKNRRLALMFALEFVESDDINILRCPICFKVDGEKYVVTDCGHVFCDDCGPDVGENCTRCMNVVKDVTRMLL